LGYFSESQRKKAGTPVCVGKGGGGRREGRLGREGERTLVKLLEASKLVKAQIKDVVQRLAIGTVGIGKEAK
jgi:hypothetical protein